MFCRLRGIGRTARATENESPTACPDDQDPDVGERALECPQDVLAGREVGAPSGNLGT
jgi:hypothetical protein